MKQQSRRIDLERNTLVLCGKSTCCPGGMGCPWRGRRGIPRVRVDLVDNVELQPVLASFSPVSFWNLALRAKIEHGAESWAHPITGVTCDCRLFLGAGSCQTCSVSVAGLQTAVVQDCSKNGKIA